MQPQRYPLAPLVRLRAQKADDAARSLAAAIRTRQSAEEARRAAERKSAEHDDLSGEVREAERRALRRGELTVADLMRQSMWEARVGDERALLARAETGAKSRESEAAAGETNARDAVAARRADADVVGRHEGQWRLRAAIRQEARDEEAAVEAWRPRGEP